MAEKRAVIFANGMLPAPETVQALISPDDYLIAADGGSRHVHSLGLKPHILIGDMDSLTEEEQQLAVTEGATLLVHPGDKDQTDLELALQYALREGFTFIRIVAALGGRLDQTLGNLALLADPALRSVDIHVDDGLEEAWFIWDQAVIRGRAGDIVSLLPWGGPAVGVTTGGLKWMLNGETLHLHKTRGISNEMLSETATVSLQAGMLLCIHRRLESQ